MGKFKNTQRINEINMTKTVYPFCPLGNDFYGADVEIQFVPTDIIMDYCEVTDFINKFNGKHLIIEDLIEKIFDYLEQYNPASLSVKVHGHSSVHLDVTVKRNEKYE